MSGVSRETRTNELGQPIGWRLEGWVPPPHPPRQTLVGRTCRVEPIVDDRFVSDLYAASTEDSSGRNWTYLFYGPFASERDYREWFMESCLGSDPRFHAIVDTASGRAVGVASYMRIAPDAGTIEVGHLNFSPRLQRTRMATEAMYLMMRQAFALGYRRYEWKCDALNEPSRRAALRLGFQFEGIFRQAIVCKGRNRDTAWYSILDHEWPALQVAFETWLDPKNFDAGGRQRVKLAMCNRGHG